MLAGLQDDVNNGDNIVDVYGHVNDSIGNDDNDNDDSMMVVMQPRCAFCTTPYTVIAKAETSSQDIRFSLHLIFPELSFVC